MSSPNIQVPFNTRIPGVFLNENTSNALTGLVGTQDKVLIIAQMTTGAATAGTPVQVFGESDAILQFGAGSIAHLSVVAAINANANVASNLSVLPLTDQSGSTDATGSFTVSTPATSAGQINTWIGDYNVQYNYSAGDGTNAIAIGLAHALMAVEQHIPVYSDTSASGVCHVKANNGGVVGNYIALSATATPGSGVTMTVGPLAGGIGVPVIGPYTDVTKPLSNIVSGGYTVIVNSIPDSTQLGYIKALVDFVSGPKEERPATMYYGYTDLVGTLTGGAYALALGLDEGRALGGYMDYATGQQAKSPVYSIAAAIGSVIASQVDPAQPYDNVALVGIAPNAVPDRLTSSMTESCLENGVCPLKVIPGELAAIVRAISTYSLNSFGYPDPTLLDITTFRTLDYFRFQLLTRLTQVLQGAKNSARIRKLIKAQILDVMYLMQSLELLQDVDTYKNGIIVESDLTSIGQVDVSIPSPIISGLHVIAGNINLILY